MSEAARTLKLNPWHTRAEDLARWAMLRLVNRTDRCGRYSVNKETGRAKPYADPPEAEDAKVGYLNHARLAQHFRATETRAVVGSYSYGADKFGKWLCIDIDNHDDKGDPLANERYAVHVARRAAALGLCVLLYESNGRGGFHLWVLFDGAVAAALLRSLGNWLVRDFAAFGFEKIPEVFPKSDGATEWGNWVRLPGRHHTRDVWPRVWNGTEWVRDADAVEHVLALGGGPIEGIPTEAAVHGIEVQTGGGAKTERPDGLVFAWEDFNAKATVNDVVAVLVRNGWARGGTRADGAVDVVRPGKAAGDGQGGNVLSIDGRAVFYCFTDGAPPLKEMKGYAPAALVALLEHGGNFKESNAKLYERGFGTRVAKKKADAAPKAGQAGYSPPTTDGDTGESELVFASVGHIVPEAVHYLVPGYIPAGMMGIFAGEGGHGKSMTTLELAAALSVGRCAFGLNYPDKVKAKTLLISCEDDWARTIVPRLAALGADRNNILRVEGVRMKRAGKVLDFHMGHFRELDRALQSDPEIKLIVIDPAGAYVGRSGVNENQDAELRSLLGPLSEAANRSGACVLLIKHLNKSAGASAVSRVGGSAGYVNAVRWAYMIAPDPDDADKKLMIPIKSNVLKSSTAGLAYRMRDVPVDEGVPLLLGAWPDMKPADAVALAKQLFRQSWEGHIDVNADTIAGIKRARQPAASKESVEECVEAIRTFLGEYAWPDKEMEKALKTLGFSFNVIKDAKAEMRRDPDAPGRLSSSNAGQEGGCWWVWVGPKFPRPRDRPAQQAIRVSEESGGHGGTL